LPGLLCVEAGYRYGYAEGTDACVPTHCLNRIQDVDAGELGVDWGGECGSVRCFGSPNGGFAHCTVSCPCPAKEGDCDYNDECQTGLTCTVGTPWGFNFNICAAPHCSNKILDADETSKDCGGADCGSVCP
jgi:hypothetical protein